MAGTDFSHLTNDELIKGIKALDLPDYIRSKAYGIDVRETLAQMTEMTIQLGVNMGLSPDDALNWARKLQESVSQSEFDSWVATLLDGGPSIFMNTLSELQTTYPNGAAGVALVRETDPAKIYVWNGSAWEDFGAYQGIEVKDGTITFEKLAFSLEDFLKEKLDLTSVENEVENPDFSELDSGGLVRYWVSNLSTINSAANGTIDFIATDRFGQIAGYKFGAINGHIYYVAIDVEADSPEVYADYFNQNTGLQFGKKNHSGSGEIERLSFTAKHSATNSIGRIRVVDGRDSNWTSIKITKPIVIDLTNIFGDGNEPTAEEFKNFLDFEGSSYFKENRLLDVKNIDKISPLNNPVGFYVSVLNGEITFENNGLKITMGRRGPNSIFDFNEFELNGSITTVSSDFFGPYVVSALENGDGDNPTSNYFTGGNHSYTNSGTGIPTGRTTAIKFIIDGVEQTKFSGHANAVEISWTNRVQAFNTTKADGTGREVLEENYRVSYDGLKFNVNNEIEALENIEIVTYYGLQAQYGHWNDAYRFVGGENRKWIPSDTMSNSGNKTTSAIILKSVNNDKLEFSIDRNVDIGSGEYNIAENIAFTSNSKAYYRLVKNLICDAGDIFTFSGYYKFYN